MNPDFDIAGERAVRSCDMVQEYAGTDWRDGMFLGNGHTGVMVSAPEHLEWVVNQTDVYDGTADNADFVPHAEVMKRIQNMPLKNIFEIGEEELRGRPANLRNTVSAAVLRLKFWRGIGWNVPAIPKNSQRLSLYDAELHTVSDAAFLHPEVISFVARESGVLCLRTHEKDQPDRTLFFELLRPVSDALPEPVWHNSGGLAAFTQLLPGGKDSYAVAVCSPGHPFNVKNGLRHAAFSLSGDSDLFLAVRSSKSCADPLAEAVRAVSEAAASGWDALRAGHRAWWKNFWSGAGAEFTSEPEIGRIWTFSLYELACSFGRAPMPGLNGLSYGPLDQTVSCVGSQGYTLDQNVQIPMMPFFPLNRCSFISVFADTFLNRLDVLKAHTRALFQCDGVCLPLNLNQDGLEYPVGPYRYTLCGSAYAGLILALAWRYSRDRELLKEKIYPLLREFVMFYLGIMHPGPDGVLHLDWTIPPEIFTMTRDDTATLSMLKTCLETAVEAAGILRSDDALRERWQNVLAHYPELAKRPDGAWWGGPDVPLDHGVFGGHQLYPFFPSEAYPDREAARKTLRYIEDSAMELSYAGFPGEPHSMHEWSAFLIAAARLRTGQKERGWADFRRFLELFGKPNGLFSHNPVLIVDSETAEKSLLAAPVPELRGSDNIVRPFVRSSRDATPNLRAKRLVPPVLEGSSAFLFLGAETLLQSFDGVVRVFPGVPSGFTGGFRDFLAQGGFTVSASMRAGVVRRVRIQASEDAVLRLENPFSAGREITVKTMKRGEILELSRE